MNTPGIWYLGGAHSAPCRKRPLRFLIKLSCCAAANVFVYFNFRDIKMGVQHELFWGGGASALRAAMQSRQFAMNNFHAWLQGNGIFQEVNLTLADLVMPSVYLWHLFIGPKFPLLIFHKMIL